MLLLLQRAAETVSGDDECNDPAVLLACALGSTGCPAKCAEAEKNNTDQNPNNAFNGVIAGDLSVAVSTSSSTVSIPNDGIVKVAELAVKASEDIQLQSIDVTRLGLSENSGIKVWIEKDGRRITSSSSFFGDSKASLTFNNGGYVVKGDETLDLVVSLSDVTPGSELQFKVSNVVSSAKNSTVSPDTTGQFRTAKYSATSVTIISSTNSYTTDAPRSYNLSKDTTFSFGEFKVQNDSPASMEKDVLIKSITFKVEGSIENLTNFKLLRDSKEISSKYTVDGKSLTFAVNDQLDSGKSATYKVTAEPTNIESVDGDKYTLSIKKAEDVIAEEIGSNATAYRVSVKETVINGEGHKDWDVVSLGTTKISGGNITLTKDSSLASTVSADWGYSDVVIAKGTMKVNQAVKFDGMNITVTAGISNAENAVNKLESVIRRAALVIDGKSYQAEIKNANNNVLKIGSELYLSKGEHNVELQLSLVNTNDADLIAAVKKLTFSAIDKDSFGSANYTNGDETQFVKDSIAGSIRVADVNITKKSITIKKTGPADDVKFAEKNTDEVVVLVGEITNNEDKDLEINGFNVYVESAAEVSKYGDLSIRMNDLTSTNYSIGGANVKTKPVKIDSLSTTVEPGKTVKFEVRLLPYASLTHAVDSFRFNVSVLGKLAGNDTDSSDLKSALITVTEGSTSTIVANTTDNKLIVKPGVSTKVASFNYNVKNDSMDVNSIEFVVSGFTAANLDDLTIDFGGTVGAPGLRYAAGTAENSKTAKAAVADDPDVEGDQSEAAINTIVVTFPNVVTLPVANYKVDVYATFNNTAIEKYETADAAKAVGKQQSKKEFKAVAFNPKVGNADGAASWYDGTQTQHPTAVAAATTLNFGHYVAKAYPVLSNEGSNSTKDSERLDIGFVKNSDDSNTVQIVNIGSNPEANFDKADAELIWRVIDGSDVNLTKISLGISKTVLRVTNASAKAGGIANWAGASISNVSFLVQDDDGKWAYYKDVNAGSEFSKLSL